MMYTAQDHTFVVCAYHESPYLEESIRSALAQSVKGQVLVSTSTPNDYIQKIAAHYHLTVTVNKGRSSIADDWNHGYAQAGTPLVTLCHQDDLYKPDYVENVLRAVNEVKHPLIFFSDYHELRNGREEEENRLLRVKRRMLSPLKYRGFQSSRFVRRRILSFGCPICCPSVTFVKPNLPSRIFAYGYKNDVDWQTWKKLSRLSGAFVYCPKPLMCHRIHGGSETSRVLGENARVGEDFEMFRRFWPSPVAKLLVKAYAASQKSNQLGK